MELRLSSHRATDTERAAVDAVVAPVGPLVEATGERFTRGGVHRARERRHLLLPAAHAQNWLRRAANYIENSGQ